MVVPLLCLLASFQFVAVLSAVSVAESLDNQLPGIARVNHSFSWSFSSSTFKSTDSLTYSTSPLPTWLSFDPQTRTFSGTPSTDDEGNPEITVIAQGSDGSASSKMTLCVTHFLPPVLTIPISEQFVPSNPALSSVFFLSPGSAIATPTTPTLRIPPKWSFSIGFQSNTFKSENDIFYEGRSSDGTALPEWIEFNSNDITFDGVVPPDTALNSPMTVSLVLLVSDQEGYTASSLPFDLVVAQHELAATSIALPTINITAGSSFSVSLLSSADFTGVLVDGDTIQPSNISTLSIDTSGYGWLKYDPPSRTLSGNPGYDVNGTKPTLPVKLTTIFNQSIQTTVSLQLVDSYFILSEFPPLHLSPGEQFEFDLDPFYSNSSAGQRGDASISVSYDPIQTANWARFNSSTARLTGTIPDDFTHDHVAVAFTAYSRITHSTSHSNMAIFVSSSPGGRNGRIQHPSGLSTEAHRKLTLALAITFGVIGGLCLLGGFFACFRRFARVEDTVLTGEEGRGAWSEKDRRWYGITLSPRAAKIFLKTNELMDPEMEYHSPGSQAAPNYGSLGLGLQRVAERSHSNPGSNAMSEIQSPGMMSKREFITKIKKTVRHVSNKYSRKPRISPPRPVIGKPILIRPAADGSVPRGFPFQGSPSNPFDDLNSQRGSTFMTGSPSTSTADHSIPRRRADFAPPRSLAQVHFEDGHLIRQPSTGSLGSDRLDVVSRTTSIISGRSTSRLSHEYFPDVPEVPPARPRLVPFTSSTRVPVPRMSSLIADKSDQDPGFGKNRISSQRAKIFKGGSDDGSSIDGAVKKNGSSDELSMGLHYVQSLGGDQATDALSSTVTGISKEAIKFVVRTGEKFHLRVPIQTISRKLQVKQISGQALPKFLRVDVNGAKGMVEINGIALARDLGLVSFGVYADKECIAKVIVEVISRR